MDSSPNWIDDESSINELEEKVEDIQKQIDELDLTGYAKLADNNTFTASNEFDFGTSKASFGSDGTFLIQTQTGFANHDSLKIQPNGIITMFLHRTNNFGNHVDFGTSENTIFEVWEDYNGKKSYLATDKNGQTHFHGYGIPVWIQGWDGNQTILLGSNATNNGAIIRYKDSSPKHTLNLGFYANEDKMTLDIDGNLTTPTMTTTTLNLNQTEINGAFTSFDVASNNPISDDKLTTVKAVIDLLYPIGSIYMTRNDLPGDKTVLNGHAVVSWLGCVWQAMDSNVFLRSCKFTISGDNTWSWDDGGGVSGGSATHKHLTYPHTLRIEEMPVHSHNVWLYNNGSTSAHSSTMPRVDYAFWDVNYSQVNFGGTNEVGGLDGQTQAHTHGDTSSVSSLPPYQNVFIYYRIE